MNHPIKFRQKFLITFTLPYILFLIAGVIILLTNEKTQLHLWMNQWYCKFCDFFFKFCTLLGDGWIVIIVAFLLLFKSIRSSLMLATGGLFVLGVINFLKRVVFPDALRPTAFFKQSQIEEGLRLVPDYSVYSQYSFPSGHTAAGFMFMLALTVIFRKSPLSLVFFVLACLIGYSRIYLSQHFFEDVYFGSMVGIFCASMSFLIWYSRKLSSDKLDQSILTSFKKKKVA